MPSGDQHWLFLIRCFREKKFKNTHPLLHTYTLEQIYLLPQTPLPNPASSYRPYWPVSPGSVEHLTSTTCSYGMSDQNFPLPQKDWSITPAHLECSTYTLCSCRKFDEHQPLLEKSLTVSFTNTTHGHPWPIPSTPAEGLPNPDFSCRHSWPILRGSAKMANTTRPIPLAPIERCRKHASPKGMTNTICSCRRYD